MTGKDEKPLPLSIEDKERIRAGIMAAGAVACGFSEASPMDDRAFDALSVWTLSGNPGGMDYLVRHLEMKRTLADVLPGAATVISAAFSYNRSMSRSAALPSLAKYAWGADYHDVLRKTLHPVAEMIGKEYGGATRICIDSAPVAERYRALKGGIGRRGRNGSVIIDGTGARVFLAEILCEAAFPPDTPSTLGCLDCGLCTSSCPTGALKPDGSLDGRLCLSALSIEHQGAWMGEGKAVMESEAGRKVLYGCDICIDVCPMNTADTSHTIPALRERPEIVSLTAQEAASLTTESFSTLFKGTAIKRLKLSGLRRNALNALGLREETGTQSERNF